MRERDFGPKCEDAPRESAISGQNLRMLQARAYHCSRPIPHCASSWCRFVVQVSISRSGLGLSDVVLMFNLMYLMFETGQITGHSHQFSEAPGSKYS